LHTIHPEGDFTFKKVLYLYASYTTLVPMHEELLDYFQKQHQHLDHYLALCFETPDDEVVHELRVSIKRIRAIFLFTEQLAGNENFDADRHYKPLRKLFRMAGKIRDVQVQQKLVADYANTLNSTFNVYLEHLDKLEKRSISLFFKDIEQGKTPHNLASISHIIENTMSPFLKEDIKTRALQILENQCDELRLKLVDIPNNKQLHQMRIIIKQMRYILGVIRKSDPSATGFPISLASLTEAEVLLGKWHDRIVGIALLNDFRKKKKKQHEPETENYNILASILEVEQRILRAKIRKSLGKSLSDKG
jgi:CHAD domain-containing protein